MPKFGFYQIEHKNNNFFSFIQKNMWEHPDKEILKWVSPNTTKEWNGEADSYLYHESITNLEFGLIVNKLAQSFLESGISEQDQVLIFLPPSLHLYSSILALQKIAAIPVLLSSWNEQIVNQVFAHSKIKAAISFKKGLDQIVDKKLDNKIAVDLKEHTEDYKSFRVLMNNRFEADTLPVSSDQIALVDYICDEKGKLKGIARSYRVLAAQHFIFKKLFEQNDNDTDFTMFPMLGLTNLSRNLTSVLPVTSINQSEQKAKCTLAQMFSNTITSASLSSHYLNILLKESNDDHSPLFKLNRIVSGNIFNLKKDISILQKLGIKKDPLIIFGIDEAEPISTSKFSKFSQKNSEINDPTIFYAGTFDKGINYKLINISSKDIQISDFTDWDQYLTPEGEWGELVIAGEHIAREYINKEIKNVKIFDDFGISWHRTGHLAKVENNELYIKQG